MLTLLRTLFQAPPSEAARETYIALVARARNPFFYESLGVPDTLDGRFELIVLHLFLLQQRLLGEAEEFHRHLGEFFFMDMDASVRELGVADTGVRYRIKAMAKAYHGRLQAYTAAGSDLQALRHALARNLYGTVADGSVTLLAQMADYVEAMKQALAKADVATITAGQFTWPEL